MSKNNVQYTICETICGPVSVRPAWRLFDSIQAIIAEYGDGVEIYEVKPKLLGRFNTKVTRSKKRA